MAEATSGSSEEFVAYRNINTDTVHLYDAESADLEARQNFVRVELSEVPSAVLDEARRERANARSIAEAAAVRRRAIGAGTDDIVFDGPAGSVGASPVTKRTGAGHPTGVLSRPGVDDVQIGPNPELHPKTDAELAAQVALDAEKPANVGVLIAQHVEGEPAAEQVPADAHELATELADGIGPSEIVVEEPEPEPKPVRKAAAKKAAAKVAQSSAEKTADGDTATAQAADKAGTAIPSTSETSTDGKGDGSKSGQ